MSQDALLWAARAAQTPLPARPVLAPGLTWVDLGEGRAWLRSPDVVVDLALPLLAKLVAAVLPLCDGRPLVEVLESAPVEASLARFALGVLRQRGVLFEAEAPAALDAEARERLAPLVSGLTPITRDPWTVLARLHAARVVVLGTGRLAEGIGEALVEAGVGEVAEEDPSGADLVVATSSGEALDAVNDRALAEGWRWLRASVEGSTVTVGPLVVPGQTACECCLQRRRGGASGAPSGFEAWLTAGVPVGRPASPHPAAVQRVAGEVAWEVVRIVGEVGPPSTLARQWAGTLRRPGLSGHDVLRVPRCPACGPQRGPRDVWDRGGESLNPDEA